MSPPELITLLVSAAEEWQRRLDALLLRRHGLSWPQFLILKSLAGGAPVNQTRLAASLGRSKGNLTGMLRRLEEEGFVVRLPEESDGRVRRVVLGPRASCLPQADADVARFVAERLAGFGAEERRLLCELLQRLMSLPSQGESGVEPPPQAGEEATTPPPCPGRIVLPVETPRYLRIGAG